MLQPLDRRPETFAVRAVERGAADPPTGGRAQAIAHTTPTGRATAPLGRCRCLQARISERVAGGANMHWSGPAWNVFTLLRPASIAEAAVPAGPRQSVRSRSAEIRRDGLLFLPIAIRLAGARAAPFPADAYPAPATPNP